MPNLRDRNGDIGVVTLSEHESGPETGQAPLRLAIAGIGLVGKRHAEAISKVDAVRLAAIVDPSDTGSAFARSNNLPWYDDLAQMLDREHPDGVILATPTALHA